MSIENGFQPRTVREVRLLNRICELKLRLHEKGVFSAYSTLPDEVELGGGLPATMHLAADVESGWESDFNFHVRGRARAGGKSDELAFGYYMGREAMSLWTKEARAEALLSMHRRLINQLAGAVIEADPED